MKVLNERMPFDKKKLKMDNFRPNIVVRGKAAFAEDLWATATIHSSCSSSSSSSSNNDLRMAIVKPCSRCTIPAVDPDSGCVDKDNTVTRVLKLFRQGKQLVFSKSLRHRGKWGGEVFFGTNAVPLMAADGSSVEVSVGQSFSVTE